MARIGIFSHLVFIVNCVRLVNSCESEISSEEIPNF